MALDGFGRPDPVFELAAAELDADRGEVDVDVRSVGSHDAGDEQVEDLEADAEQTEDLDAGVAAARDLVDLDAQLAEARYAGTDAGHRAACGAPMDAERLWSRWSRVCARAAWSPAAAWSAVVDAYHDELERPHAGAGAVGQLAGDIANTAAPIDVAGVDPAATARLERRI